MASKHMHAVTHNPCLVLTGLLHSQVKDATLKKVKAFEEQKEAVETERDTLKVGDGAGLHQ
jgi:hypothetical protein